MFQLFPRKPSLRPISPELHQAAKITADWCLSQTSTYNGNPVSICPAYGAIHDQRIAAYADGFLSGYLQTVGTLMAWAQHDEDVLDLGHVALSGEVMSALFGTEERALALSDFLPFNGNTREDLVRLDRFGSADGIAHAKMTEKQHGGLLLHYLRANIAWQQPLPLGSSRKSASVAPPAPR